MNLKAAILVLFLLMTSREALSEKLVNSDITSIRLISTEHSISEAHNYVMVLTTKIEGCSKGLFFKLDENPAIYSSLLAVKVSGHSELDIDVDKAKFEPWASLENYCALTGFEIVY